MHPRQCDRRRQWIGLRCVVPSPVSCQPRCYDHHQRPQRSLNVHSGGMNISAKKTRIGLTIAATGDRIRGTNNVTSVDRAAHKRLLTVYAMFTHLKRSQSQPGHERFKLDHRTNEERRDWDNIWATRSDYGSRVFYARFGDTVNIYF